VPVDQKRFGEYMQLHGEGMSLAELKEAAGALGMTTTVRRCSIAELQKNYQLPFIAHLAMITPHYSVVIDISDDKLTLLDGTTGKIETLRRSWVEERWSGYVLLPQTGATPSLLFIGASLLSWLLFAVVVTKGVRALRTSESEMHRRHALPAAE
jgi:ABC-type bacteriocin/lantibiotic exporter with double-glycine peptidase domain